MQPIEDTLGLQLLRRDTHELPLTIGWQTDIDDLLDTFGAQIEIGLTRTNGWHFVFLDLLDDLGIQEDLIGRQGLIGAGITTGDKVLVIVGMAMGMTGVMIGGDTTLVTEVFVVEDD